MGLDTLPLFLGILTYCYFWPGRYLTPETRILPDGESHEEKTAAEMAAVQPTRTSHEVPGHSGIADGHQSRMSEQESLDSKATGRAV